MTVSEGFSSAASAAGEERGNLLLITSANRPLLSSLENASAEAAAAAATTTTTRTSTRTTTGAAAAASITTTTATRGPQPSCVPSCCSPSLPNASLPAASPSIQHSSLSSDCKPVPNPISVLSCPIVIPAPQFEGCPAQPAVATDYLHPAPACSRIGSISRLFDDPTQSSCDTATLEHEFDMLAASGGAAGAPEVAAATAVLASAPSCLSAYLRRVTADARSASVAVTAAAASPVLRSLPLAYDVGLTRQEAAHAMHASTAGAAAATPAGSPNSKPLSSPYFPHTSTSTRAQYGNSLATSAGQAQPLLESIRVAAPAPARRCSFAVITFASTFAVKVAVAGGGGGGGGNDWARAQSSVPTFRRQSCQEAAASVAAAAAEPAASQRHSRAALSGLITSTAAAQALGGASAAGMRVSFSRRTSSGLCGGRLQPVVHVSHLPPYTDGGAGDASGTASGAFATDAARHSVDTGRVSTLVVRDGGGVGGGGVGGGGGGFVASNGRSTHEQGDCAGGGGDGSGYRALAVTAAAVAAAAAAAATTALRKSERFLPLSLQAPHHRSFHLAWAGGLVCCMAAFAPAALMPVVQEDLQLSRLQSGGAAVATFLIPVLVTFPAGLMSYRCGPRYSQILLLLIAGTVLACTALVSGSGGFILVRLLLGTSLAIFPITQSWIVAMFDYQVLGAAATAAAGLSDAGGGLVTVLLPLLYGGLRHLSDGGVTAAWRQCFQCLSGLCLATAVFTFLFGQDTPSGDVLDPKPYRSLGWQPPDGSRHRELVTSPAAATALGGITDRLQQRTPQAGRSTPSDGAVAVKGSYAKVMPPTASGISVSCRRFPTVSGSGNAYGQQLSPPPRPLSQSQSPPPPQRSQSQSPPPPQRSQSQLQSPPLPPPPQRSLSTPQTPVHKLPPPHEDQQLHPHEYCRVATQRRQAVSPLPLPPPPPPQQQQPSSVSTSPPPPPSPPAPQQQQQPSVSTSPPPPPPSPPPPPQQQPFFSNPPPHGDALVNRRHAFCSSPEPAGGVRLPLPPPCLRPPSALSSAPPPPPAAPPPLPPPPSQVLPARAPGGAAAAAAAAPVTPSALCHADTAVPAVHFRSDPVSAPATRPPSGARSHGTGLGPDGGGGDCEGGASRAPGALSLEGVVLEAAAAKPAAAVAATAGTPLSTVAAAIMESVAAAVMAEAEVVAAASGADAPPSPPSLSSGLASAVLADPALDGGGDGRNANADGGGGGDGGRLRCSDDGRGPYGRLDEHLRMYRIVLRNPICWLLALNYGLAFGAQLVALNILPIYLTKRFQLGVRRGGAIAGVFGLLNLGSRLGGHWLSAAVGGRYGMRGRLWALWALQTAGGGACAALGFLQPDSLAGTLVLMVVFAVMVQQACGVAFSITPFVSYRGFGAVTVAVATGGQLGAAIMQGAFFDPRGEPYTIGFQKMGLTVVAASASIALLHFPMWGGMLRGPAATAASDVWAEERYYAQEWTPAEREQGLAAVAAGFALLSKSERGGGGGGGGGGGCGGGSGGRKPANKAPATATSTAAATAAATATATAAATATAGESL